jgi:hypothetical protein
LIRKGKKKKKRTKGGSGQKITSCRTTYDFFIRKSIEILDFMDKTNFFFDTLPFSPWLILATWLHLGAPQNYMKNEFNTRKIR